MTFTQQHVASQQFKLSLDFFSFLLELQLLLSLKQEKLSMHVVGCQVCQLQAYTS